MSHAVIVLLNCFSCIGSHILLLVYFWGNSSVLSTGSSYSIIKTIQFDCRVSIWRDWERDSDLIRTGQEPSCGPWLRVQDSIKVSWIWAWGSKNLEEMGFKGEVTASEEEWHKKKKKITQLRPQSRCQHLGKWSDTIVRCRLFKGAEHRQVSRVSMKIYF